MRVLKYKDFAKKIMFVCLQMLEKRTQGSMGMLGKLGEARVWKGLLNLTVSIKRKKNINFFLT